MNISTQKRSRKQTREGKRNKLRTQRITHTRDRRVKAGGRGELQNHSSIDQTLLRFSLFLISTINQKEEN